VAIAELFREVSELDELIAREAAAHHACADGREALLKLRRDADVVAVDVVGDNVCIDG